MDDGAGAGVVAPGALVARDDERGIDLAGEDVVDGGLVVVAVVGHRTDDGELVHLRGGPGHMLGDADAWRGGLDFLERPAGAGAGLEVPDIDGSGAAAHPQDDDGLVLPAKLLGIRLNGAGKFEAGKGQVRRGGLVTDPAVHRSVLEQVTAALAGDGLVPLAVMPSPLRGASGNIEFLGHFRVGPAHATGPALPPEALGAAVEEAHRR